MKDATEKDTEAEERGEQGFGKAAPAPKDIYAIMTLGISN